MLTLISYFSSSWNMYFIKLFTSRNMHLTRHVSLIIFRKDDFAGHKQPPWPSPIPLVMQAFTNSKYSGGGQLFLLFVEIVIWKCFQQTLPNLNKLERTVYIIFLDPTSTPGFPLSNPDSALLSLARSIQLPLIRFLRYPGLDAPRNGWIHGWVIWLDWGNTRLTMIAWWPGPRASDSSICPQASSPDADTGSADRTLFQTFLCPLVKPGCVRRRHRFRS